MDYQQLKNKTMKNLENQLQILNENRGETELREYVEMSAQSDPNFFRWLFGEDFDNDFDSSMTSEQKEEYNNWLETL
jgi:succinate dehydrogenase flavin-adding protein (antitoxin of CptAB toxin-antitoxin module)